MNSSILASLISALLGGVVVACMNYFLTRKKMQADIAQAQAVTQRTELEIKEISQRLQENLSATVGYMLASTGETLVYTSSGGIKPGDFRGQGASRLHSPEGRGELSIEDGMVSIHRTNTEGRFVVALGRYSYKGHEVTALPRNELLTGGRKLRLQCDARVVGGEHTLDFAIREDTLEERWLAHKRERIVHDEWIPIHAFFRVPSNVGCFLWIEDRSVSKANSTVLLRNLSLAERTE